MKLKSLLFLLIVTCLMSCKHKNVSLPTISTPSEVFNKTWNAGKAELSSYTLQQARYGEIRNGESVLIFVVEDFSQDKLVKLDDPGKTNDKIRVLKMNMTKKFLTGIYPYSMMLSVFTPVSLEGKEKTVKVNCSSQEWCGHTFSQLQLKGNKYKWQLSSYFEQEGERDEDLDVVLLEDEIWNRIRINPDSLPVGKFKIIPGLFWQRLSHTSLRPEDATLSLGNGGNTVGIDSSARNYTIHYPASSRTLKIYFKNIFPYEITGWEESYPDGFGANKKMLTTKAVLKKTAWLDYWKRNAVTDSAFRDTLQLMRYD